MRWQSETAFTESKRTLPCACRIISISCKPYIPSVPWQRMHQASILRRQMPQRYKSPPAFSMQRDACANIEKAELPPIIPIDMPRQRCITTGLRRAQVPLRRKRTHPSISRLKPNVLFHIQADRIHSNAISQRSRVKAGKLVALEQMGILHVKALHCPHCSVLIARHLAGKMASNLSTKTTASAFSRCAHML